MPNLIDNGNPTVVSSPAFDRVMTQEQQAEIMAHASEVYQRREEQKRINKLIGDGKDIEIPTSEQITLQEAIERFVFVCNGSRVADINNTSRDLILADFYNAYVSSRYYIERNSKDDRGNQTVKRTLKDVTKEWFVNQDRKQVDTRTFMAGAGLIVNDPDGKTALNLWDGFRDYPEVDDAYLASIFTDHIKIIFGESTDKFLDWLAHIQQKPGELPHYGWISIATKTGMGRNWIASVLTKVFAGYVAPSFDLPLMLETGFNGGLSKKVLAIVDEIQEGGNGQWKHAQKLKTIVNQEYRTMNPKCAPMHTEFNSCRWLVLSNHLNAIPLDKTDRRFEVVITEAEPKEASYYTNLYKKLADPQFIAAVFTFLKKRNIDKFNPGARPEMTSDKARMIEESKSEPERLADELMKHYPYDIITNENIGIALNLPPDSKALRPICDAVGMGYLKNSIRVHKVKCRVRILRNHHKWIDASNFHVKEEVEKFTGLIPVQELILKAIEAEEAEKF